jgi:hypothetical protein
LALLIRFDDFLWESLLAVIRYIKRATGEEPNQEELAQTLGSYFILNEVGNQLKYLKKKRINAEDAQEADRWRSRWNFNLLSGPPRNNLARAGLFIGPVGEAIDQIRAHARQAAGNEISDNDIARSLRSSFILSEIVNQVNWLRQEANSAKETDQASPDGKPPLI